MSHEILNNTDTSLPTVNSDLKEVFPDIIFHTMRSDAGSTNVDAAGGIVPHLNAPPQQEPSYDNFSMTDVESLFALIDSSSTSSFSIVPSKKERGKPYFNNDEERILTTKKNEPVHLQLDICKPGQKILLTLRYTDPDYCDQPMTCNGCSHAYKGCLSSEDHNDANFCVRSRDGTVQYMKLLDGQVLHPTAVITVASSQGPVDLQVAFKCRNSCSEHKKYGSDRTLRLVLLNEQGQELCRNEWNLRVCESAKRDHNLVLSKAGAGRTGSITGGSSSTVPCQLSATPPPVAAQHAVVAGRAADVAIQPPPLKRVKVEDDTVIHYINAGSTSSTIQQVGTGQSMFRYGTSQSTYDTADIVTSNMSSSGVGSVRNCFDAKPLLPIAPPPSPVVEAPAPADVMPVMVYPNTEADKKLLKAFAERLGMNIYNVNFPLK